MVLVSLVAYLLGAFGVVFVVGFSGISLPMRKAIAPKHLLSWGDLFRQWLISLLECPACLGFWIGLCWGLTDPKWVAGHHRLVSMVLCAFATSGGMFLLGRWTGLIALDPPQDESERATRHG